MSTYKKKTWVNNETKVNATNMNHIEEGIYQNSNDIDELKQEKNFLEIISEDFTIEGDKILFKSDIAKEIMGMNKRIKADYSLVEDSIPQGQFIAVLAPRAIIDYSSIKEGITVYEYSTTNWLLDTYRTTYVEFIFDKNTEQLYLPSDHPATNEDHLVGFDTSWDDRITLTSNSDMRTSTINPLRINDLSTTSIRNQPNLLFTANGKDELESVEFMQNGYSSDFIYTVPKGSKHYVVNELPTTTDIDTTGNYYVMTESVDGREFSSTTDITSLDPDEYPPIILGTHRQGAIVNSGKWVKLNTLEASDGDYYGDIAIKFNITCNVTVSINPKQPYETSMGIDVNGKNVQGASTGQTHEYTRVFTPGEILYVWGKGPSNNQLNYKLEIQSHIVDGKIPLSTKVDEYINYENMWFKNGGGSSVVANPTLSGDEATLNGLEVDGTKYKVGGSEVHLYRHHLSITTYGQDAFIEFDTISTKSEPYTTSTLRNLGKMICTNIPTIENSSNQSNLSWFTNVNIGSSNKFSFSIYSLTFNNDGTVTRGFNTGQQFELKTVSDTVTEVE